MEKEKNKNNAITILVIAVIILLVAVALLVTGIINLSANKCKETPTDNTVTGTEIDSALLNSLYDVLGINWDYKEDGDCLNKFLSNNNYKDVNYSELNDYSTNAKRIFSLYASHNNMNTYRYNDYNCKDDCKHSYTCSECTSILKTNAEKIKKIYGLTNLELSELPGISTDYAITTGISVGVCHYSVTHDLDSKYVDSNSIRIVDKQVVTDYKFGEDNKINSTKEQDVTYDFKKGTDGNYYLDQVTVK